MVNSIEQFVNVEASRATAFFEAQVVPHPQLMRFRNAMRTLHARVIPDEDGRRIPGHILLAGGESGSGKSFGLQQYAAAFPRISRENIEAGGVRLDELPPRARKNLQMSDYWPVLLAEANESTTNRGLAATLYEAFGYKTPKGWSMPVVLNELKATIEECGTEIILVDEAHHIINHKKEQITETDVDFVKSLSNQLHVQIVLAGLPRILDMGESTQIRRRKEPDFVFEPYRWHVEEERGIFNNVMTGLFKNIRLSNAMSSLSDGLIRRLYVSSGGYIGLASKHLSIGLYRAIDRGVPEISMLLHAEVFHDFLEKKIKRPTRTKNWEDPSDISISPADRARNPFLADESQVAAMIDALAETGFATPTDAAERYGNPPTATTRLRGKARAPFSPLKGN